MPLKSLTAVPDKHCPSTTDLYSIQQRCGFESCTGILLRCAVYVLGYASANIS